MSGIDYSTLDLPELRERKIALIESLRRNDQDLTRVNGLMKSGGRMENGKFKQCCDSRTKYAQRKLEIERELMGVKAELSNRSDTELTSKKNDAPPKSFVTSLVALRQEYQEFAADKTRVGSMRQMAAEFVLKLNPIIKSAITARLEAETE